MRAAFGLEDFITARHLDNMAKVMLATGMIVAYGYLMESFMAWYSRNPFEEYVMLRNRPFGNYAHTYWMMLTCNVFVPQLLWFPGVRRGSWLLWIIAIIVNIGMWLERYVIVVTSLSRDFLPSSWSDYHGTVWDYATFYGSIGLFFSLLFLFIRFLPVISIAEMRELVHETQERHGAIRPRKSGGTADDESHRRQSRGSTDSWPSSRAPRISWRRPGELTSEGYRMMEAYTPFPVEGLAEALGFHRNRVPRTVSARGTDRRPHGLLHAVVLGGHRLSDQRGGPAAA